MSIGAPSNLGTLLIQRLEAALGATLGQQANLVSGTQPNAVTQPGNPENPSALQNQAQRHPREAVDKASAQDQGRAVIGKATDAQAVEGHARRNAIPVPSAPITLGFAARTILALLAKYPESVQLAHGHSPLVKQAATPKGAPSGNIPTPAAGGTAAALPQGMAANPRADIFTLWPNLATTIGQPGTLSIQFAQSMAQVMRGSGLFYESHLASLAFGKTTVQALRQEPQGQIKSTAQQGPIPTQGAAVAQDRGAPTATQFSHQGGSYSATSHTHPAPVNQTPVPSMDPQTQLLVRQQLEVLAHQSFAWQGLAWPGTAMYWKVERCDRDVTGEQTESDKHWATCLNLQLPALGEVQARLTLAGDHLVMRLAAPESADHLREHIESLRGRLLAHGLKASQLSIKNREDLHSGPSEHEHPAVQT